MGAKRASSCEKRPVKSLTLFSSWRIFLGFLALWVGSCTIVREFPSPPRSLADVLYEPAVTYASLKTMISTRCVPCHGPQRTEARYDISSYAGLLGGGTDATPNAIAGDANSLLLTVLREDATEPAHRVNPADTAGEGFFTLLRQWVVDYRLAYFRSSIHSSDIHLPGTTGFHGSLLQKEKWNWAACTRCHGEDLAGGSSGVSCISCHDTKTKKGCESCHTTAILTSESFRSPSTQSHRSGGLHQRHARDAMAKGATCQSCHPVPTSLKDNFHLDGQIQVQLSLAAAYQGKKPLWDASSKTCTETYCHGAGLDGAKAPTWTPPTSDTTSCQSCHGMPPKALRGGGEHPPDTRCSTCHPSAHTSGSQIKEPTLHLNGQVEVSFQGDCKTCHGDAESPAPPRDLAGRTETTAMGVGAHRSHHQKTSNGRHLAVPCSACHKVPSETFSKGHIDTAAPAEVTFQGLAALGGLTPRWEREKGTCSQVYCHGASLEGGKHTTPIWNQVGTGQQSCGSCHGMPPRKLRSGDSHTPSTACSLCHKHVRVDGTFSQPELHINGRVEL